MVEKRTETRVTTETVEVYVCPSCGQQYDRAQMVNVGLGYSTADDAETSAEAVSMLCRNCADSVFGYDGPTGSVPDDRVRNLSDERAESADAGRWWIGIVAATVLWIVFWAMPIPEQSGPFQGVWLLALFVAWGLLPVATYYDVREVRRESDWEPNALFWVGVSLIWLVNVPVAGAYLLRRRQKVGRP